MWRPPCRPIPCAPPASAARRPASPSSPRSRSRPAPLAHAALLALPDLAQLDDITLYRTLAALVEAGLAHRVLGTDGVWRYGAPPGGHPGCPGNHAHFFCSACRAMACLPDQPIPRITLPPGAAVDGRHLLVFGRCAPCVAAGSAP